jgi:class 3 adenylate cyclase
LKNFRLVPVVIFALAILPLDLFIWISSSIVKKSIKSTVVNDPQAALTQSLNGLAGNYDRESNRNLLNALHFASKDSLKKALSGPITAVLPFKNLSEAELSENPAALFVLVDTKGNVLYDNLGIPKPTPSPSPTSTVKKPKSHSKFKALLLASVKDWPGMDVVLAGSKQGGLLALQGSTFLTLLMPVESKDKILGVVAVGSKIDDRLMRAFKNTAVNDIALYSQAQTWYTGSASAPKMNYPALLKAPGIPEASSIPWGPATFLTQGLPLMGLDQKPAAYLAVFQPVKQIQTVEGTPLKSVFRTGILFLFLALVLVVAGISFYLTSFNRLFQSIGNISRGNLNVSIPQDPWTEWGQLGGTLQEMLESLREKERISLILGKVVDPHAARKILAEKDYFSLKGERRECTLLRADLKGFNTLSENMAPEALVEALNQYFSIINDVVFKHEGMLDRFIGDTAIAVWGAPFTHEDKEARAVKAALEIQEALRDFNISRIKKGHPPFTVGIGIHTGTLVAGNLGSNKHYDYSIIGEALHVVARLCAMAAPGQTVVSEETYVKIKTDVKANPLNPIAVKGNLDSLKTYEVTQLSP